MENSSPSAFSILVVGLQNVGKTSIIKRIVEEKFDPNVKPTVGMEIYRYIIDKVKFSIFDAPGQERLRNTWFEQKIIFDGILFVVDLTASPEHQTKAKQEFDRLLRSYPNEEESHELPILILGNKLDLYQKNQTILNDIFWNIGDYNYHFGYCSALTNEGIKPHFTWLISELVKRTIIIG